MKPLVLSMSLLALIPVCYGQQSSYCPQKGGYIHAGMTPDEVLNACGEPLSKQKSDTPVYEKVPVQQLMFNPIINTGQVFAQPGGFGSSIQNTKAFYSNWSVNTGGAQMQVTLMDDKVQAISINGSGANASSICGGASINVGDPAYKVYNSCGQPALVNNTFINKPIASATKPEIWVYQPTPYGSAMSLTFVNGKLQSIK